MNHAATVMANNDDEQPSGLRPYRPFTCDTCFKAFTRSVSLDTLSVSLEVPARCCCWHTYHAKILLGESRET